MNVYISSPVDNGSMTAAAADCVDSVRLLMPFLTRLLTLFILRRSFVGFF